MEINVGGGDLQKAIDAAKPGDTLLLEPGRTYQGNGEYGHAFGYKPGIDENSKIKVQSAALSRLPEGQRIKPFDAGLMPKLVPANDPDKTFACMTFLEGSMFWDFAGIETTTLPGQPYATQLINGRPYTSLDKMPYGISFDRMYVHSLEDGTDNAHGSARMGFNFAGKKISVKNSRVSFPGGYVGASQEVDNQYAFLAEMIEDVILENNFLCAWYNALFTGGASMPTDNFAQIISSTMTDVVLSSVKNLNVGDLIALKESDTRYGTAKVTAINGNKVSFVSYSTTWGLEGTPLLAMPLVGGDAQWNGKLPTNFLIRRNQFHINPVSSQQIYQETLAKFGQPSNPKGYFEIKAMDGALFEGNDFTGQPSNWAFTVRNQGTPHGAPSPWSTIKRVTMRGNRYLAMTPSNYRMIVLSLEDNYASSTPGGDILFEHNLITNVGKLADVSGGDGVTFRHNTLLDNFGSSLVENIGQPVKNFVLKDNILANNEYGVHCPAGGFDCFPNLFEGNMAGNIIVGKRQLYRPSVGDPYPKTNFAVDGYEQVGFIDLAGGNYKLADSSPFKGKGTDGKDPGADIDLLMSYLGGTATPTPVDPPTPTKKCHLAVNGGTGTGDYSAGTSVTVTADVPAGKEFVRWNGNVDSQTPSTTIKVVQDATITAEYKDVSTNKKTNVALATNGATASASSTYDAVRPASAAINGERAGKYWEADPVKGSGWHSRDKLPQWLQIDFKGAKTIDEVQVFGIQDNYLSPVEPTETTEFSLYGLIDYTVEYWNGTAWVALGSVTGNKKIWNVFSFAPVTTSRIRVTVKKGGADYARIAEVEAYEAVAVPQPTNPHFEVNATLDCEVLMTNGVPSGVKVTVK